MTQKLNMSYSIERHLQLLTILDRPAIDPHFRVHCKALSGMTATILAAPTWDVGHLLLVLEQTMGARFRLRYDGKYIEVGHTLESYGIKNGSTVYRFLNIQENYNI